MCVYMCVCACVCMRVCVCVYASTIERTKKNIRVTLYYRICTVYAYEKLKRKRKKILEMFKTCVLPFFEITRHLLSSFLFPFDRMVSVVSLSRCSFENDSIHVIFSFRVIFFFFLLTIRFRRAFSIDFRIELRKIWSVAKYIETNSLSYNYSNRIDPNLFNIHLYRY